MLSEEKRLLRQAVCRQAASLSPEFFKNAGERIAAKLVRCPEYRRARTVFGFVSMAKEIDMTPFLRQTLGDGKQLAVPLCTAPGYMEARLITGPEDLLPGHYGILEPKPECPLLPPEDIEFAVIPCVTCDRSGRRLGHGGGYYDRYLAKYKGPAALVCPEALIQPLIPTGPLDRLVGLVVTEREIYRPQHISDHPNKQEGPA